MSIESPGNTHLDIGNALAEAIRREWKPENTDGIVPTVQFMDEVKRVRFMNQDYILINDLQEFSEPVTVGYAFENILYTAVCQAVTAVNREHAVKMRDELKRCLYARRIEPFKDIHTQNSGNIWLQIRRISDSVYRRRLFWVWSCDLEIKHRFRAIP